MIDNQNHSPEEHRPESAPRASRESRRAPSSRIADREVPIKKSPRTPEAVHAWLDGDLPEAAVRRGDTAKHVEFWNELNTEVDKRRQMRTPPHVYAQIMDSLPQTTPRIITPWWRRPFAVTPALALMLAAGALVIGAAVAALLMRAR